MDWLWWAREAKEAGDNKEEGKGQLEASTGKWWLNRLIGVAHTKSKWSAFRENRG